MDNPETSQPESDVPPVDSDATDSHSEAQDTDDADPFDIVSVGEGVTYSTDAIGVGDKLAASTAAALALFSGPDARDVSCEPLPAEPFVRQYEQSDNQEEQAPQGEISDLGGALALQMEERRSELETERDQLQQRLNDAVPEDRPPPAPKAGSDADFQQLLRHLERMRG